MKTNWTEAELAEIEAKYSVGMSVQQVVDAYASRGERLTEATFRKYVQLGLLPRSVRVRRQGKRRGSQGLYPSSVVRQIAEVRRYMDQGYTMEEIQREFLFVRGDIEELNRHLEKIFASVEEAMTTRGISDAPGGGTLGEARERARELVACLLGIERRCSMRARME